MPPAGTGWRGREGQTTKNLVGSLVSSSKKSSKFPHSDSLGFSSLEEKRRKIEGDFLKRQTEFRPAHELAGELSLLFGVGHPPRRDEMKFLISLWVIGSADVTPLKQNHWETGRAEENSWPLKGHPMNFSGESHKGLPHSFPRPRIEFYPHECLTVPQEGESGGRFLL